MPAADALARINETDTIEIGKALDEITYLDQANTINWKE